MTFPNRSSLVRAASALAVTFALTAPVFAQSSPAPRMGLGMGPGYPACEGIRWGGAQACPLQKGMRGMAAPAMMGGRMLGVHISDMPNAMLDATKLSYGVVVEGVRPDTAAAAAGIRMGDVIVEFAGKPVISAERLRWLVRKADAGKDLEVKLMRDGAPLTLNVNLPEAKPADKEDAQEAPKVGT